VRPPLSLLLLCLFTFFLGLGSQAVTDADEAYYAEASREMVESGDWLTPRFNYEHRWEKPVLYYWLTAATYVVAGPTETSARLWAALSGVGLALLTWGMARQISGRPDVAWLAGAIVATSFGYFAMARAALPDLPLTFCITLGIWSAMRAVDTPGTPAAVRWWALAGVGAGAGFLMKGPVALVVPAVVLLPIAWRERTRLRVEPSGLLVAAVVAVIVGVPWYVAMWREHGAAYLDSFFIGDNFERFATERFNEPRPFWFYVPVLLGGLMPWSLYLVALTVDGLTAVRRRTLRLSDADWRLLLWALLPLLFYTLSIGQQPRYILPVLPPLAVLVARGILDHLAALETRPSRSLTSAAWATAALFAVLALLFVRMQPLLINAYPIATWSGALLVGGGALVLGAIAATRAWHRLPMATVAAAVVLLVSVQFGVLAGRRPEAVEQIAMLIAANRTAAEPIGIVDVFTRNLVFYTRLPRRQLFDHEEAAMFLRSPERVFLVVRTNDVDAIARAAGVPVTSLGEAQYVNTANFRLRTLLRPDPTSEIERVSLVTNR
jgi:4-amino-4-deoxy-L-arabinose transferase-like glycosyltransferase